MKNRIKTVAKSVCLALVCIGSVAFWWVAPNAFESWISEHFPIFSGQGTIAEIQAVSNRPMIAVRPALKTKQTVLLHWRAEENLWYWTWPSAPDWSQTPDSFFQKNGAWWIERNQPKFGHTKEHLGIYAQIKSWSFSAGKWQGTGAPPTINLE